jgi:hypothetical protein
MTFLRIDANSIPILLTESSFESGPEGIMNKRTIDLAERFKTLNNEMIAFVENCSDENWRKECPVEQWPVGVVARHVAASHFGALGLVKMIVAGEKLPDLTGAAIDRMNLKHADKHRDCTRDEVLKTLRENGGSAVDSMAGLDDADLDRIGHVAAAGGDLTVEQIIENILLRSAGEHLDHAKAATGS